MSERLPRSEAELGDLADFYAQHDVSEDIEAGDVVTPEPMVTASLRLPAEVLDKLRAEAADRGVRYTTLIRDVLIAHVTAGRPSSRALASRLDRLEREYDLRLRRLEDAQRHRTEIASEGAVAYTATPADTDAASSADDRQ